MILALLLSVASALVVQGNPERLATLDPYAISGSENFAITGYVIEPLARIEPYSKSLIPALAESWHVRGREIHVRLRKGVQFHNEQPFTSADVKFTFESYFTSKYGGQIWQGMWPNVVKIETPDERTVIFHLEEFKFDTFQSLMTSLRILPRNPYAESSKAWRNKNLIGTGPFRVKKFKPDQVLDLEPNTKWWSENRPQFDLRVKSVSDASLAAMMVAKGALDFFPAPAGHGKTFDSPTGQVIAIALNLKRPLFSDLNVRRALLMAWNRAQLNEKVFGGAWRLALDPFAQNTKNYPVGDAVDFNPKGALKALKGLGWKIEGSVLAKEGQEFRFTVLTQSAEDERWVTLFQNDMREIGVHVEMLRVEEESQRLRLLKDGKFDALATYGGAADEPYMLAWHSQAGYSFFGYAGADADLLKLAHIYRGREKAIRRLILKIREDQPQLPGLYRGKQNYWVSERLDVDPKLPAQAWRWRLK